MCHMTFSILDCQFSVQTASAKDRCETGDSPSEFYFFFGAAFLAAFFGAAFFLAEAFGAAASAAGASVSASAAFTFFGLATFFGNSGALKLWPPKAISEMRTAV